MIWSALTQWSAEPVPVLAAAMSVLLYVAARRAQAASGTRRSPDARDAAYAAGLIAVLLALLSPIAAFDTRLQWDHMLQHVLMLVVSPPLLLVGEAFPTACRGVVALNHGVAPRWLVQLQRIAGSLRTSRRAAVAILIAFSADLLLWHIPAAYNLTLANDAVHDLEHTLFFATGLLFWDQVIGTPATRPATTAQRTALTFAALLISWALAVVIGYASHPLYAYPLQESLNALTDQQIAAGIMWVPAGIPWIAALIWIGAEWFEREERAATALEGTVR